MIQVLYKRDSNYISRAKIAMIKIPSLYCAYSWKHGVPKAYDLEVIIGKITFE